MLLSDRVASYIEQEGLLEPAQRVVVGVSGGADSLCLLHCLLEIGYRPLVAHFDHGLRPDSPEDAELVRKTAESLGVPFHLGYGHDLSIQSSVEEVARTQRYQFLASVAMNEDVIRVAVGHTANDQAETVLMHLIRGAGPSGLRGMLPKISLGSWIGIDAEPGLHLVRPLLDVWRDETTEFCQERGFQTASDSSNQDVRFFRNRLRKELLPELENFNPRVQERLVRTAKLMAAESEALNGLLNERWSDWAIEMGDDALMLRKDLVSTAPLALQREAMRRAILYLAPELRDISFDSIERALAAMKAGQRTSIPGGLDLFAFNGDIVIRRPGNPIEIKAYPLLNSEDPVALDIPGEVQLGHGWRISVTEAKPRFEFPPSHDEAWFDGSDFPDKLLVRRPRPGDRISPLGMSGSMKVSDLFINRKVPKQTRSTWPIVTANDQIVWIPGLHRYDGARVTDRTQIMVKLRLVRPSANED